MNPVLVKAAYEASKDVELSDNADAAAYRSAYSQDAATADPAVMICARYAVSILTGPISPDLLLGTIIVNVTGSLVIGLFATLTMAQVGSRYRIILGCL